MVKKVFIDPILKKYVVPTELRDNSLSDGKMFTPGTRIKLENNVEFIRLFSAWATDDELEGDIDLDLGAAFIGEDDNVTPIAYYNQTESMAVHSGDFTNCRAYKQTEGLITSEFIDIDIEKSIKAGYKYVLTGVFIFNGAENFNNFISYSGVQLLDEMRTEKQQHININNSLFKVELKGDYTSYMPLAIDLITKEIVIIDKYQKAGNSINIDLMTKELEKYKRLYFNSLDYKENMSSFLNLYCKANGYTVVEDYKDADIICSYNDYKDLRKEQLMYNISTNLESILNLLN